MAIIATLNPVENGYPANIHSIASIPLNKLVPWDGNVRKTASEEGLEELTASIAAHGVLQSLVVRKVSRGKYSIIAGRRRYLALSALAEGGTIEHDAPVPCRIIPGSADATEISLTENVVRAPMHPADQFEAFRDLIEAGSTVADIAARFGISETAVKKRLTLARVSPVILEAYRKAELSLEQVQAFTASDDHTAQERLFSELSDWNSDADDIRSALTQDEIAATDKRARFVGLESYELAGGHFRKDLFAEGDEGIFLLNPEILDRLVLEKLQAEAEALACEGWKWIQVRPEFDYEARGQFRYRSPEPLPLSEEPKAERKRLADEYQALFESIGEDDEETSDRLNAIEERIDELEDTERAFTPETLAIAGTIVTLGHNGEVELVRGLVRPEDAAEESGTPDDSTQRPKPPFSASLIESLTSHKSAAIGASLCERPDIALACVVYTLASGIFAAYGGESAVRIAAKRNYLRGSSKGLDAMEQAQQKWAELLPARTEDFWQWCLSQDQGTLLSLLAFCTAHTVDAVQRKADRPGCTRLLHADALALALSLDMSAWFTPTADNYFSRVSRADILAALAEAKNQPPRRSWEKLKKSEFAALAERELAGSGWLPQPLRLSQA